MREIMFRGKMENTKLWIEGDLRQYSSGNYAIKSNELPHLEYVHPETIGQFTGMTDKNGKRIFEGDIIRAKIEGGNHEGFTWQNMPVDFQQGAFCLNDQYGRVFCVLGAFAPSVSLEVIGNIHDNPELLKGGD